MHLTHFTGLIIAHRIPIVPPHHSWSGGSPPQHRAEREPSVSRVGHPPPSATRSMTARSFLSRYAARLQRWPRGNVEPKRARQRGPRKVHGKDAPPLREIARVEPATVGFGAPSAEPEPDAQAGPVGALLRERGGQLLRIPGSRKAATFVLDVDDHAIGAGTSAQCYGTVRPSELERVLRRLPTTAARIC